MQAAALPCRCALLLLCCGTHTHTEISEAFEVLSDEKKKKLYDQFGEAGLGPGGGGGGGDDGAGSMPFGSSPFAGARRAGGGGGAQTFSFSTGGGGGGGGFHGSDPFSVFESFFGTGDVNQGIFTIFSRGCGFLCFALCFPPLKVQRQTWSAASDRAARYVGTAFFSPTSSRTLNTSLVPRYLRSSTSVLVAATFGFSRLVSVSL